MQATIEKGAQNHQKSITFFTITDMGFYQVEIPYKSNGNLMILRVPCRPKSTFGTPADVLRFEKHRLRFEKHRLRFEKHLGTPLR